jgi:hypothetical protein
MTRCCLEVQEGIMSGIWCTTWRMGLHLNGVRDVLHSDVHSIVI